MSIVSSAISSLLGGSGDTWVWKDNLHPASFRGVPFGVVSGEGSFGRRQAVHEYPYRDSVWVEDMGRSTRRISITGFLVQSSLGYKAADVMAQRDSLVAACEQAGPGTLIHPTLGELTVSIPEGGLHLRESKDSGRVFEFTLTAIESGLKVFAITNAADAVSTVNTLWLSLIATTATKFISEVKSDLRSVTQAIKTLKATAAFWTSMVMDNFQEATNLSNVLKSTFGSTRYGRYNTGSVGGSSSGTTASSNNTADTQDYSALVDSKIASSVQNSADLKAAIASLDDVTTVEDFTTITQGIVTELLNSVTGGDDLISMLETLSSFSDSTVWGDTSSSSISQSAKIYFNSLTAGAMAYAAAQYSPASYEEAQTLTRRVVTALDAVTLQAADNAYDEVYEALQTVRSNFVTTMQSNGADLARLVTVTFNQPLPALAVANRLYQDAGRTEGVVKMADPVHPAFMPTNFKALTS